VLSQSPLLPNYIKAEGMAGRMGARLMAIVCEGDRGRIYLSPSKEHEEIARHAEPKWKPEQKFFQQALGFRIGGYGMTKWADLFTSRQLVALTTFSDLVNEVRERIFQDFNSLQKASIEPCNRWQKDDRPLHDSGGGPRAYAEAVSVYLACALSRAADYWGAGAIWEAGGSFVAHVFTRNALGAALLQQRQSSVIPARYELI
jgi:putative DNA methylase